MLSTIIETVPMEGFIDTVASKVLSFSVRWARSVNVNDLPEAGTSSNYAVLSLRFLAGVVCFLSIQLYTHFGYFRLPIIPYCLSVYITLLWYRSLMAWLVFLLDYVSLIKFLVLLILASRRCLIFCFVLIWFQGSWAKQILIAIDKTYPSEWRGALRKFLEVILLPFLVEPFHFSIYPFLFLIFLQNSKTFNKEEDDVTKTLSLIIDGSLDMPLEISDSKIWFALEHPKVAKFLLIILLVICRYAHLGLFTTKCCIFRLLYFYYSYDPSFPLIPFTLIIDIFSFFFPSIYIYCSLWFAELLYLDCLHHVYWKKKTLMHGYHPTLLLSPVFQMMSSLLSTVFKRYIFLLILLNMYYHCISFWVLSSDLTFLFCCDVPETYQCSGCNPTLSSRWWSQCCTNCFINRWFGWNNQRFTIAEGLSGFTYQMFCVI